MLGVQSDGQSKSCCSTFFAVPFLGWIPLCVCVVDSSMVSLVQRGPIVALDPLHWLFGAQPSLQDLLVGCCGLPSQLPLCWPAERSHSCKGQGSCATSGAPQTGYRARCVGGWGAPGQGSERGASHQQ